MKTFKILLPILVFLAFWVPENAINAQSLAQKLAGRFLLQIESRGEAWFVDPKSQTRDLLGSPDAALRLFKNLGMGISNQDLNKIPVGNIVNGKIVPTAGNTAGLDLNFAKKQAGKILLQVQDKGEAWYVNPVDNHRYLLGQPPDVLNVIKALGLGIKNSLLEQIPAYGHEYDLRQFEQAVNKLINQERIKAGLSVLHYNNDIAKVALEHSRDLANEDEDLTSFNKECEYPLIHHEGLTPGLYAHDRLNLQGIYDFSSSGENIALMPALEEKVIYSTGDEQSEIDACESQQKTMDNDLESELTSMTDTAKKIAIIKDQIKTREKLFNESGLVNISQMKWETLEQVAEKTVQGWMNSPGHRANILKAEYNETGLGAAYVNGYIITTQVFVDQVDCGYKSGPCCQKTGYYPYCFEPLQCGNDVCQ